jgi:cysteine desulfurase family protein (TIGR01976 family)
VSAATAYDVAAVRARFPSLGGELTFFDAPGGSQVPATVSDAVASVLRESTANLGGTFATSLRTAAIVREARAAAARFLGCTAEEVIFGANMTSLNFALSRVAGRDFAPGDEIAVTRLDHDANVAPWLELAHDHGLEVRLVDIDPGDTGLDYEDLAGKLGARTRVVAFNWASNACGTVTDAARVCAAAHAVGALAWIDATHFAAHEPIDVRAIGADVLVCAPYKVCGPHLGLAYGRAEVLESWRPYKVRPAPDLPVGARMETGTLPYEQLAGFAASIDYLDAIGGLGATRVHTHALGERFLAGLPDGVRVIGRPTMEGRVPTFLLQVDGRPAPEVSAELVAAGFCVTASDTFYCLGLKERLGFDSALRVGIFHYHTAGEVDALLGALHRIVG